MPGVEGCTSAIEHEDERGSGVGPPPVERRVEDDARKDDRGKSALVLSELVASLFGRYIMARPAKP